MSSRSLDFSSMNLYGTSSCSNNFEQKKVNADVYEETEKNPEIYDVNTYDSFVSTTSDLTDVGSLSEAEKYSYGSFNFFALKRSQFNNEVEDKNIIGLNQDVRKNVRGMY